MNSFTSSSGEFARAVVDTVVAGRVVPGRVVPGMVTGGTVVDGPAATTVSDATSAHLPELHSRAGDDERGWIAVDGPQCGIGRPDQLPPTG